MASILTVDTIQGSTTAANVKMPKGHVIQVESTIVTTGDTSVSTNVSINGNNFLDIPGMAVSITPKYATSKILVTYSLTCSASTGQTVIIRLMRDSTPINVGTDATGSQLNASHIFRPASNAYVFDASNICGTFLDSPATTSATTYKLQFTGGANDAYNYTLNLNRVLNNSTTVPYAAAMVSNITVMEIAQ